MATSQPLSIHYFPPELLAQVFTLATLVDNLAPLIIAQVSAHWRARAISMTDLWTIIQLNKLSLAALYLERSGALPVDLHVDCRGLNTIHLRRVMNLARPHWHRWACIAFEFTGLHVNSTLIPVISETVADFLENASTADRQLRRFSLILPHGLTTHKCIAIPLISSLQRLELFGVSPLPALIISSEQFTEMRELELGQISGIYILRIMSVMPHLTRLVMKGIIPSRTYEPAGHHILMMNLEVLELKRVPTALGTRVLETISAPNLRRLVLHSMSSYEPSKPVLWQLAASSYRKLVYLSIFDTSAVGAGALWVQWLKDLKELQHLDISYLCRTNEEDAVYLLRSLADPSQDLCPSLLRLQVNKTRSSEIDVVARGVMKHRSAGFKTIA